MNCFRIFSCCRPGAETDVAPAASGPVLRHVSSSDSQDPEVEMLGRPRIPLSPPPSPRLHPAVAFFRATRAAMAGRGSD